MSVAIVLSVLLLCEKLFSYWQINKLIDKLMSRNYYDYEVSKSVGTPVETKSVSKQDEPLPFDAVTQQQLDSIRLA